MIGLHCTLFSLRIGILIRFQLFEHCFNIDFNKSRSLRFSLVIILCYTTFFTGSGDIAYYTQIDNSKLSRAGGQGAIDLSGNGGMDWSYTLPSYDKDGGEKDITFGVSRELREGAFLRLTVRPGRGVMTWAEVQYDELPPAVQGHYGEPSDD